MYYQDGWRGTQAPHTCQTPVRGFNLNRFLRELPVIITVDPKVVSFDTEPFTFRHTLGDEPLLSLPALSEAVAENEKIASFHAVGAQYDGGWDSLYDAPRKMDSAAAAIDHLAESSAWIKIRLNEDARYSRLTASILEALSDVCHCSLDKETSVKNLTVFVSSPHAVTPYHFDHETNFLFQIAGKKLFAAYDARVAEVMPQEDLENYYVGNDTPFRPEADTYRRLFDLTAGDGVHNPSLWPHWAETGDELSVTLSVNICLRKRDKAARIYQCNYYLRRLGLNPRTAGTSRWSDALKKLVLADPFSERLTTTNDLLRLRLRRFHGPIAFARKLVGARSTA